MPRIVLAEFNTHRAFSRNSASSRAIPFKKMVQSVQETPFIPIAWQKDHKGMQGTQYITNPHAIEQLEKLWLRGRHAAIKAAEDIRILSGVDIDVKPSEYLTDFDNTEEILITKQLCNRLLEPFMYHTVLVSATEWSNFMELRSPQYELDINNPGALYKSRKDLMKEFPAYARNTETDWLHINRSQAEIHIQAVAEAIHDAMNESTPKQLKAGEWHIPFGDQIDSAGLDLSHDDGNWLFTAAKIKIATARCARLSYMTLGEDPKIDYEADIKLHDMLLASGHMSPFEHCARVMNTDEYERYYSGQLTDYTFDDAYGGSEVRVGDNNDSKGWCRNFRGFIQYRHIIESK